MSLTEEPGRRQMDMDLVGADPSVLARIRKTIGTTFAEADEPHLGDVTLAAVELVTNAFEHGDGPRSIRMSHRRSPCLFELAVEDSNTVAPVMGRSRFGDDALRGRGLRLVDGLAKAWGVDVDAEKGTKTVWATISCPDSY